MASSILIVEDDQVLANDIREHLERDRWETHVAHSAEEGLKAFETLRPDLVLTDHVLPGKSGLELIQAAHAIDPRVKVIMLTGDASLQLAVAAMKAGASDYLTKPVSLPELKLVLEKVLAQALSPKSAPQHRSQAFGSLEAIVGESPPLLAAKARARQVLAAERRMSEGDLPAILITGETGTGKELLARALHFEGVRGASPFVEINCASLPPNLLESELFGHERGAFTDAKDRRIGLVEAADGGTVFLDEIGEVDLTIQAKLLKLLEEKSLRRIGSVRERKVNIRIISATNRDLEQLVREGRFRSDLYFRLHVITLAMPALRDCGDDILHIARFYLENHARRYGKKGLRFTPDAELALLQHAWPGNVRELRNTLEQVVLLAQDDAIGADELMCASCGLHEACAAAASPTNCNIGSSAFGVRKAPESDRELVVKTLEKTDWNISKSAKLLGLTRDMLRYRIVKYGFARPQE